VTLKTGGCYTEVMMSAIFIMHTVMPPTHFCNE